MIFRINSEKFPQKENKGRKEAQNLQFRIQASSHFTDAFDYFADGDIIKVCRRKNNKFLFIVITPL